MGRSGPVRDAIMDIMRRAKAEMRVEDIRLAVDAKLGKTPPTSVRSYLANNTPGIFIRTGPGRYRLATKSD